MTLTMSEVLFVLLIDSVNISVTKPEDVTAALSFIITKLIVSWLWTVNMTQLLHKQCHYIFSIVIIIGNIVFYLRYVNRKLEINL